MNGPGLFDTPLAPLPEPVRTRWLPLRLGLVELYRYDSEEFWFRDGHLLLRGNNGTGKSKVLSLTLPLLLDAQLRSARVEPDGDPGKKMAWNLLLGGAYERRTGYSWIEFGRLDDEGRAHFTTLGVGLQAGAARSNVEAWFFIVEGERRIGRDLWLMSPQRLVHTRERLREAIGSAGQIFDSAQAYRRAVDEALFQLGSARYDALMDTLIQLRQPQLSRRPDETALSQALTEALPPLPQDLLADVAEALTRLEDDRRQLEQTRSLLAAVHRFEQQYRLYAGIASRRQARELRQAQTGFDRASAARHVAQQQLEAARLGERSAAERREAADRMLAGARHRLDTLQADPLNQTANQLELAQRDAKQRERAVTDGEAELRQACADVARDQAASADADQRVAAQTDALVRQRREARAAAEPSGVVAELARHRFVDAEPEALARALRADPDPTSADEGALLALPARRREQLGLMRRRLAASTAAQQQAARDHEAWSAAVADAEDAAARRANADAEVDASAERHLAAWTDHLHGLHELRVDAEPVLAALSEWLPRAEGDHPALAALHAAQGEAVARIAAQRHAVAEERRVLGDEQTALADERQRLERGEDTSPAAPLWRGEATRDGRAGAPLWQLLDFDPALTSAERAGLEAALDAAGLLDAWVAPGGERLQGADGGPWNDAQLLARRPVPGPSLAQRLRPDPGSSGIPGAALNALLHSIACTADDSGEAEAWIGLDGRFRLAGLAGAGRVVPARFIGHAARAAARAARLGEIRARLAQIDTALAQLEQRRVAADRSAARIDLEWRSAPSEQDLRKAHEAAAAANRELVGARRRADDAQTRRQRADDAARAARDALAADAADLRLPPDADALDTIEAQLHRLTTSLHALVASARLLAAAHAERERQTERRRASQVRQGDAERRLAERRIEHEEARTRLGALEAAHGDDVQALKQRIVRARAVVQRVEQARTTHDDGLRRAAEERARAEQRHTDADAAFTQSGAARALQVERWRAFAATGLLASALASRDAPPEIPPLQEPWTIEPALQLARRAEQALAALDDADERWKRVQTTLSDDLAQLQRELGALGHQAIAEPNDFGIAVHIFRQQQAQAPAQLAAELEADVQQREALLSAREREVLENHLQAEIANRIQRLMRAAEMHTRSVNTELHKRPTSTGVRFRLQWLPLPDGEGAPVGLAATRERLLTTGADLWSSDDKRVIGTLLQQRIQDERRRGESALEPTGSLLDQLASALDYRRWHRFRVERLQDGQWRRLSGPASSGERALGLTVPLFAAIASFYRDSPQAPRLMMLDEAFAGIDDAARSHCMGLVHEFDLDFVITSEREWGCYATLPGVAICQLQRREGIDAVFVSRWHWDGVARRREADVARRFPAAEPA